MSTSGETRETETALLTCNVRLTVHLLHETHQCVVRRVPNSQQNQVERLFPEFFTRCSDTSLAESYKVKTCVNSKLKQRQEDPLIQSWLNLYGGGSSNQMLLVLHFNFIAQGLQVMKRNNLAIASLSSGEKGRLIRHKTMRLVTLIPSFLPLRELAQPNREYFVFLGFRTTRCYHDLHAYKS